VNPNFISKLKHSHNAASVSDWLVDLLKHLS